MIKNGCRLHDMTDAELAAIGCSWEPIGRYLAWSPGDDDRLVLAFCNARYVVNGATLGRLEDAIRRGVPNTKIRAALERMAVALDRGE